MESSGPGGDGGGGYAIFLFTFILHFDFEINKRIRKSYHQYRHLHFCIHGAEIDRRA